MARHNEICDRFVDLDGKSFTPSHMRNDPLIFAGFAVKRSKANPARSKSTTVTAATPPLEATEQKGGLLIRDIWKNETDNVNNMCVMNTDAKSHLVNTPEKCLQEAERVKNKM